MHQVMLQLGKPAGTYLDVPHQLSQEEERRLRHGVYVRPGRSCTAGLSPSAGRHAYFQLTEEAVLPAQATAVTRANCWRTSSTARSLSWSGLSSKMHLPLHEFTKSKTAAGVYTPGSSRVPLLLPVLLLDTEPSLDSRRVAPPAGGTGDGGGKGPPRSLTALAALLRETLTGEMPSAQSVSVLDVHY